jgi:hypothetical protein
MSGLMLKINGGVENAGLLHVDNLIDYMYWSARSDLSANEIFNVRDHSDVSWQKFIQDFGALIQSRSWVIDLSYPVANIAAHALSFPYHLLFLTGEPVLHPLLVRIFGRTCGHSAEKLWATSRLEANVPYEFAIKESAAWFLEVNNKAF